jgi:hypothetical protein
LGALGWEAPGPLTIELRPPGAAGRLLFRLAWQYYFGNPGDKMLAGDCYGVGEDSLAVYRPSSGIFYIRFTNTQGMAGRSSPPDDVS